MHTIRKILHIFYVVGDWFLLSVFCLRVWYAMFSRFFDMLTLLDLLLIFLMRHCC